MKLLFLRGQVPSDRDRRQIMFDSLDDHDDMWVQLAHELVKLTNGYGEVWYERGHRVTRYNDKFLERWVDRWTGYKCNFSPDVVFARGGFKIMLREAEKYKSAFKIHYGAGHRVVPKSGQCWDLVLVDTHKQWRAARRNGYNAQMFIKPAADNIFFPRECAEKHYDVIYVANWNPNANKGHRFLLSAMRDYRVLHVGYNIGTWAKKFPNTIFGGWMPRICLPDLYAAAKVAVVMTVGKDSCPRVIPEALACNCPIIVSEETRLWHDRYINKHTGCTFNKTNFTAVLDTAISAWRRYQPYVYYKKFLSLPVAAKHVLELMERSKCVS